MNTLVWVSLAIATSTVAARAPAQQPRRSRRTSGVSSTPERLPERAVGSVGSVTFVYQGVPVTYPTVRGEDGNIWLQKNLGARTVASQPADSSAFGDLFQWGRWDDGHQLREPANTRSYEHSGEPRSDPVTHPNDPLGLRRGDIPFLHGVVHRWWDRPKAADQWAALSPNFATTTNGADPCAAVGARWRLPTAAEFARYRQVAGFSDAGGALASVLRLPISDVRDAMTARIGLTHRGAYWTSTADDRGGVAFVALGPPEVVDRGSGLAVRCLRSGASAVSHASVLIRRPARARPVLGGYIGVATRAPDPGAEGTGGPEDRDLVPGPPRSYSTGTDDGTVRFTTRRLVTLGPSAPIEIRTAGRYLGIELVPPLPNRKFGRPFLLGHGAIRGDGIAESTSRLTFYIDGEPPGGGWHKEDFLGRGHWIAKRYSDEPLGTLWVVYPVKAKYRKEFPSDTVRLYLEYNPLP